MPTVVVTTRLPRLLGKDLGMSVCPILEGEGYNGFLVCSVEAGSPADGRLRPGDRILITNGVPAINYSKFMEGICHQFRINTIDALVLRHYAVGEPHEWDVVLPKAAAIALLILETDASINTAPLDSGLLKGDLVLSVDGAKVEGDGGKAKAAIAASAGSEVKLRVARGRLPPAAAAILPDAERSAHADYLVAHVNPAIQGPRPLGLFARDLKGKVVVCTSDAGTGACEAGLIALDRVLSIGATRVRSVAECAAAVKKTGGTFWMLVERPLSIPELVHDNKVLTPSMGVPRPYPDPVMPDDIHHLRSKLASEKAKSNPSGNIPLRSISKEALSSSRENVALPIAVKPAPKLAVSFADNPAVHHIAQDVEPRKRR